MIADTAGCDEMQHFAHLIVVFTVSNVLFHDLEFGINGLLVYQFYQL